ncbi:hypothetical protein [Halorussus marinus]|nr:hypothetical protein [Halorussus marinus]
MYRYAKSAYIDRGGSPRVFDEMTWAEIEDWIAIHDIMDARQSFGGVPDE